MCTEADDRTRNVLSRALNSPSRALRMRAVLMLTTVDCPQRTAWIDAALRDRDPAVREAATLAACWTATPADARPWPAREEVPPLDEEADALSGLEAAVAMSWQWEYAVEVWRDDGLLVGVFLATSFAEDDHHARAVALGQAILHSTGGGGDAFDPATAATFIVGKRRVPRHHG